MSLEALPTELLVRITGYLEKGDVAKLRLVNTRLQRIATEQLFHSVTLYAHWRHEQEQDDSHSVDSEHHDSSDTDGRTDEIDRAFDHLEMTDDRPVIFDYTYSDRMFSPFLYKTSFLGRSSLEHHRPPPGFEDESLLGEEWPFLDAFLSWWRRRDGFLDPLYIPTNEEGSTHFELFYTFMKGRMAESEKD